ncbi:MAG TPA: hypothetical protein VFD71_04910 [Planctomycetota bacterium]|nr:hypothetical protein [Planctomycetota bacterium]
MKRPLRKRSDRGAWLAVGDSLGHHRSPRMSDRRSYAFISCVADGAKLEQLRASVESLAATGAKVRLAPIDNAANAYSAAQALNLGWSRAEEDLLVFCHEDVVFPPDWTSRLEDSVRRVEAMSRGPWGVLGPMGRRGKTFFGRASGPDGVESHFGPLPSLVDTLDEFCLVVRRDSPLRFDERLGGFHLYGVDLCLQATEAGLDCFAVETPCRHDSWTRHRPPEYHACKRRLQRKWMFGRRRVGRSVGTTCGRIRFGLFEGWI